VPNTIYSSASCVSSRSESSDYPKSNLINNCSMVNYLDIVYYPNLSYTPLNDALDYGFYGYQSSSYSYGFKYANPTTGEFHKNLSDSQLQTKLNNNENIINNLTKIGLRHI